MCNYNFTIFELQFAFNFQAMIVASKIFRVNCTKPVQKKTIVSIMLPALTILMIKFAIVPALAIMEHNVRMRSMNVNNTNHVKTMLLVQIKSTTITVLACPGILVKIVTLK